MDFHEHPRRAGRFRGPPPPVDGQPRSPAGCAKGCAALLLAAVGILFGMALFVEFGPAMVGTVVALAAGWVTYPLRVWPGVSINTGDILMGLGTLAVAALGLHLILRRLRRTVAREHERRSPSAADSQAADDGAAEDRPTSRPRSRGWSWPATIAVVSLPVLAFGFVLSATGLMRQTGWLLSEDIMRSSWDRLHQSRSNQNFRQLVMEMILWHTDERGEPSEVFLPGELLASFRTGPEASYLSELTFTRWDSNSTPDPVIPIEGIPTAPPEPLPVLVSQFNPAQEVILVAFSDASVETMSRDEWHQALADWRRQFAELDIPWPAVFEILDQ